MRKEIADLVFPVFRKAIEIKEALRVDPKLHDFADTQKKIFALLKVAVLDHLRADFYGDMYGVDPGQSLSRHGFLGIRYALTCWLDEIFIADSPWTDRWNVNKAEQAFFGDTIRNTEFWKQAQKAQARPTYDALEVYYLCVMLGFRGELIDKPAELLAWRENVETQLAESDGRTYTAPPDVALSPAVPPLTGAETMQKWFLIAVMFGLPLIPLGISLAWKLTAER
ncbi:MAG: DotU family type IV/VI secretion system protein [Planctomycetes bacterium]|nr:DotU family type IV/VI secretion system protein [Planctomycetota bacterium]